eukprot:3209479-Rhodomonas_salina.3
MGSTKPVAMPFALLGSNARVWSVLGYSSKRSNSGNCGRERSHTHTETEVTNAFETKDAPASLEGMRDRINLAALSARTRNRLLTIRARAFLAAVGIRALAIEGRSPSVTIPSVIAVLSRHGRKQLAGLTSGSRRSLRCTSCAQQSMRSPPQLNP